MLRKIFGSKKEEVTAIGENCTSGSFTICTPHKALPGQLNKNNEVGGYVACIGGKQRCIRSFGEET
jgi:hypothetical protein